jgi:hypothetical protein
MRRSLALLLTGSLLFPLLPAAAAWSDEPTDREEMVVPPPPGPMGDRAPMAEEPVVVPEEKPVGAPPPPLVEIERSVLAAGVGFHWGGGVLEFEGARHPFQVRGLSLGDVGASRTLAVGDVENLWSLSDFEGRYVAVEAGAAVGLGAAVVAMRNEKGVVITLRARQQGGRVTLGPEGLDVRFQ